MTFKIVTGTQVSFAYHELTQLVQYLGNAPELPVLDPPLYCWLALELAQYILHTTELAVSALPELVRALNTRCGPHLGVLLRRIVRPYSLGEQVVQAQLWGPSLTCRHPRWGTRTRQPRG